MSIKRKFIRLFFREQWSILICDETGTPLKELVPPKDRIWADPFPVLHDGRYFLFLEEQCIGSKGILGCMELFPDLSHGPFIPVLALSHHLSWPNVFSVTKNDTTVWYMIPESNRAGTIEYYRAEIFPYKWKHDSTLISGIRAADPEIFHDGNTWFMFASIHDATHRMNDSLFVFCSTTFPSSEWKPLPGNPVVRGKNRSRMAGKIYRDKQGILVRPAQDCTADYGKRVILNRIDILSPDEFTETVISTIPPDRKLKAVCTHTWNPCGQYIFRDIKKRFFEPKWRRKTTKGIDA